MRIKSFQLLFVVFAFLMSGCYINSEINTNQVGVQLEKNKIQQVVGPGVYSAATCFWCDIKSLDVDTLTFSVDDPEVLTKDNQAVSVKITIQARRQADDESVTNVFTNWSALVVNQTLIDTISSTAREGLKNGTRGYTLTELLDDRNGLAEAVRTQLELDTDKYSVEVVNVTIENIGPSPAYMAILSETANIKAQTDQEIRRRDLINQQASNGVLEQEQRVKVANAQVLAEEAQTAVEVEIANRAGEIIAASNQVYIDNPQAYQLEQLRIMQGLFGEGTVYFIPQGTDLTTYFFPNTPAPVLIPQ